MKSLRARIAWTTELLTAASILVVGGIQIESSSRYLNRMVDDALLGRTEGFMRGPGPGQGQGPGQGRGGPDGPRGPRPESGQNQLDEVIFLGMDGKSIRPAQGLRPFDEALFEQARRGGFHLRTISENGLRFRIASRQIHRDGEPQGVVQVKRNIESLIVSYQTQWLVLLATIPLVLGLAWLASRWISRTFMRPVDSITALSQKIAEDPDSSERIAEQDTVEMSQLAGSINNLTSSLQKAKQATEAALERQRRFTSDASHEMRTPLTSISLACENALHPKATAEERLSALESVEKNSRRMSDLISNLLVLARHDSHISLELAEVELRQVTESVVNQLSSEQRSLVTIDFNSMIVESNASAVEQILSNFVENALAYGNGTPVEIGVIGQSLFVKDQGPGIEPEKLPHVFERFFRSDPSRNRASGGFGLGLAICESLAHSVGATVSATSILGSGATFFINFQKKSASSQLSNN